MPYDIHPDQYTNEHNVGHCDQYSNDYHDENSFDNGKHQAQLEAYYVIKYIYIYIFVTFITSSITPLSLYMFGLCKITKHNNDIKACRNCVSMITFANIYCKKHEINTLTESLRKFSRNLLIVNTLSTICNLVIFTCCVYFLIHN